MKTCRSDIERRGRVFALGVWENEGGTSASATPDRQYGRRIEADRSWTIYHVFTGVPAQIDGEAMTGLSRSAATSGMLSLNLRNIERRKERVSTRSSAAKAPEEPGCQS